LSLWIVAACGPDRRVTEAKQLAVDYAVSLRQGDTIRLRAWSTADFADLAIKDRPDTEDPRLSFSRTGPEAVVQAISKEQIDVFVIADSLGGLPAGVLVIVRPSNPPRVRLYQLVPDVTFAEDRQER